MRELEDVDVGDHRIQQDGATCHTGKETINYLKEIFSEWIVLRHGPVAWSTRSCDLKQNYFLRGYVKSLVYADKPETIDALEKYIWRIILCQQ